MQQVLSSSLFVFWFAWWLAEVASLVAGYCDKCGAPYPLKAQLTQLLEEAHSFSQLQCRQDSSVRLKCISCFQLGELVAKGLAPAFAANVATRHSHESLYKITALSFELVQVDSSRPPSFRNRYHVISSVLGANAKV